jgi:hypothetical protein
MYIYIYLWAHIYICDRCIPDYVISNGKYGHRFYNQKRTNSGEIHYTLKEIQQYSEERRKSEKPSKRYFSTFNLEELVLKYPLPRKDMPSHEIEKEMKVRRLLVDFLKRVLQTDPMKRLTPQQAASHPFITGNYTSIQKCNELISLGKHIRKRSTPLDEQESSSSDTDEGKEEGEKEEVPFMLTGLRKSFANKEPRSGISISPYSRKRYESILSPLMSPPSEKNDNLQLRSSSEPSSGSGTAIQNSINSKSRHQER